MVRFKRILKYCLIDSKYISEKYSSTKYVK